MTPRSVYSSLFIQPVILCTRGQYTAEVQASILRHLRGFSDNTLDSSAAVRLWFFSHSCRWLPEIYISLFRS